MDSNPDSSQPLVDVRRLSEVLEDFAQRRDWMQFHSPKNLAMALTGEVGELVEIYQWMSEEQSREATSDPETRTRIEHEMADVLLYLVRMASVSGIDLERAVREKLQLNERKYPSDLFKGSREKSRG